MLTPEYLLKVSEGAEDIAEQLHQEIIDRIVKRIMARLDRGDSYLLTAYDKWQIQVLEDAGFLLEDIKKEIAKKTKLMQTEVAEAMEEAGVKAITYDNAIYEAAGISTTPLDMSPHLIRLMQRDYEKTLGEMKNFTGTLANSAQKLFIQECDKAYNLVTSGAMSYTQAVKEAVEKIASDGVTVHYPSGHTDTIETATLRAVRTGVAQATADITNKRMEEYGWDIILVSSHLGARVTDNEDFTNHYWWQGKFYSKSGKDKRFPPFSVCGMGHVQGLCGANCRHSYGPGDGEFNPYRHYDSEENRKAYETEQRQRALERRIRKTKREVMTTKTSRDNAQTENTRAEMDIEYQKKAALLQKQNKAYNDYCAENNLKKRADRIAIAKWDRQQAASARGAAKRYENSADNTSQNYKPVIRSEQTYTFTTKSAEISVREIEGYNNVYVSDNANIKPKALHDINKNTSDALEAWNIPQEYKPKIIILDNAEMPTALGRYDAVENTVYYVPDIASKEVMENNGGVSAVEYHEMWHLKQATDFRKAGWNITRENYAEYLKALIEKCERVIDKAKITRYNVNEISNYAEQQYLRGRYDEVEAELMVKRRTK